ncbi:MAG TPA: cytochrome c oxidase assembly protein [Candidatus Acidoferrales bacterium]|nr:cytochrome c oxidase assembly protein [Candidatus Acidoferrales bacterium]
MPWSPLLDWSFEPVPIVGAATAAYLYWRGRRTASPALGRAATWDGGDTAFTLGLGALVVALVSPIAYFDITLQWDHMLQHVLLLLVAPPLILLGDPFRTAWAGYLAAQGRPVSLAGSRAARMAGVLHSGSKVATLIVVLFSANLLFWHVPAVYNSTLRIASIHDLEHLTFLVFGLLFWDQVISVLGMTSRLSLISRASMTLAGMGVSWGLAIAIGYATVPLYAYPTPNGGLSLLADQEIAAGVMWVPGSVPFLVTLIYLGIRWFDVEDRRATSAVAAPR